MRRHRHNRPRTVAHHHVIGNVNRNFLAVYGIHGNHTVKTHACFVFHQLCALKFCLFRAFGAVTFHRVHIGDFVFIFINNRMLGRHNHKGHAEQSIGARGVNAQGFGNILQREIHESTAGLANPVDLLLFDIFGEIKPL